MHLLDYNHSIHECNAQLVKYLHLKHITTEDSELLLRVDNNISYTHNAQSTHRQENAAC